MVSHPGSHRAAFRPIQVVDRLDQPVRFAAHRRDFGVELRTGYEP